jgi:hypothetical protein
MSWPKKLPPSRGRRSGLDCQINQHPLAGFTLGGADLPFTVSEMCAYQARITMLMDVASE